MMMTEATVRIGFFFAVLLAMAIWEILAPRRRLTANKPVRWCSNLGLVLLNAAVIRLVVPAGAIGAAMFAENRGLGLFHAFAVPAPVAVVLSVVLLDFVIYLQHVMFHAVPVLWRLHMVHHADLDVDASTGIRFHTLEVLLSFGIKVVAVVTLGAPASAVLAFEVLLNATSMFSHGNVRLPPGLDRVLRWIVVTPDMHRVHHSVLPRETNSNFGFNLPWWDYVLGTYRSQPTDGHENMTLGLAQFRSDRVTHLPHMLALPFGGRRAEYPIARRSGRIGQSDAPT